MDYAALGEHNCTRFLGGNGAPDISHNAEVPWFPESVQVGTSGSLEGADSCKLSWCNGMSVYA